MYSTENYMKKSNLLLLTVLAGFLVLSSCKKKTDTPAPILTAPAPATVSKTPFLINKDWKLTEISTTSSWGTINGTQACEKDDLLRFSTASSTATAGTYVMDYKEVTCKSGEVDISGEWVFNTAQTEINVGSEMWKIDELNSNILKITVVRIKEGTTYTDTKTYK